MHSSIMYELHIVPILVDVNNPVKYSAWDAEVMKCYFLPLISSLSPVLSLKWHSCVSSITHTWDG